MINIVMVFLIIIIVCLLIAVLIGAFDIHVYEKPNPNKIRVACVGDSITYGFSVPFFFLFNYPAILQRRLGNDFQIGNFGLNDRTAQSSGNKPYCKEKAFEKSIEFKPDIVIFFLGANDTKDINFHSEERFIQEYKELLECYRKLESKPKIILVGLSSIGKCPPFMEVMNDCVPERDHIINGYIDKVASEYSLALIDLYTLTSNHPQYYSPDRLHLNGKGQQLIADCIYPEIMKVLKEVDFKN